MAKGMSASVRISFFVFWFFMKTKPCLKWSSKQDLKSSDTLIIKSYKLTLQSQTWREGTGWWSFSGQSCSQGVFEQARPRSHLRGVIERWVCSPCVLLDPCSPSVSQVTTNLWKHDQIPGLGIGFILDPSSAHSLSDESLTTQSFRVPTCGLKIAVFCSDLSHRDSVEIDD